MQTPGGLATLSTAIPAGLRTKLDIVYNHRPLTECGHSCSWFGNDRYGTQWRHHSGVCEVVRKAVMYQEVSSQHGVAWLLCEGTYWSLKMSNFCATSFLLLVVHNTALHMLPRLPLPSILSRGLVSLFFTSKGTPPRNVIAPLLLYERVLSALLSLVD